MARRLIVVKIKKRYFFILTILLIFVVSSYCYLENKKTIDEYVKTRMMNEIELIDYYRSSNNDKYINLLFKNINSYPNANFYIGEYYYQHGEKARAVQYLESAAKSKNAKAAFYLGEIYLNAYGVKYDPELAKMYYKIASDAGLEEAMFKVAYQAYNDGNINETKDIFLKLAESPFLSYPNQLIDMTFILFVDGSKLDYSKLDSLYSSPIRTDHDYRNREKRKYYLDNHFAKKLLETLCEHKSQGCSDLKFLTITEK